MEEPTPTRLLDITRVSSDQVRSFNRAQADIIRALAPGHPVTHSFMSHNTDFDHYALGEDIDIASWDSYPMDGPLHSRLGDPAKQR